MKYPDKIIIVTVILIICHPAVGLTGDDPSGETWWQLVERANRNEEYVSALDYLSRIEINQPDNPELARARVTILNNLGNKYYQEGDIARARDVFLEALEIDPANFVTLRMLGEISYFSQHLDDAERYWKEALAVKAGDPSLRAQLTKLNKEKKVEGKLNSSSLANFDIRYHGGDSSYDIYDIQSNLLEAYQEIGYDFNYYPIGSIVVLLYTGEEFSRLRDAPHWVGALNDGKIRLPVRSDQLDGDEIKAILWHEYTHSLIKDETNNNCPRWLHEGLAQHEQAKVIPVDVSPLDGAIRQGKLIPLSQLDRAFGFDQSGGAARLAYAEAYSLTEYLLEKYGFWKINVILQELKKGRGWRDVFEEELLMPVSELEKEWREAI